MKLQEGPDTIGPGMSPKIGHEDEEGLAYLRPVTEPHPKSKRSKDIEILFGRRKKEKTKEDVAQDRRKR